MKAIATFFILIFIAGNSFAQNKMEFLDFEFQGVMLNGVLNIPEDSIPKGIVLIVHGSGRTNAVAEDWYNDVRESILKSGYATYMWDKMGCGKSEGTFNYNQSVQSSALEVIAAIKNLKEKKISGSGEIGLWGISRAGWINPIVINKYKDIKFWISVSGVDEKENFKYLLEQNLNINGHSKDSVKLIVDEWLEGTRITHSGGSFEEYMAATVNLSRNPFWLRFTKGGITEEGYYNYQQTFMKEDLDEDSGLQVYIEDFDSILSDIKCPVLAIFGENDMNIDWVKTKSLYKTTLSHTNLTIKSFPDCNHNMFHSKTGGFYEMQDKNLPRERCNGFLDAITNWLNEIE
jgi:alpha/beta superfamily hydrolase